MGIAKEMKLAAKGKSKAKGPSKYSELAGNDADGAEGVMRVCDGPLLLDVISSIVSAGDAILLGTTRDGGAVTVTVYEDGERVINQVYGDGDKLNAFLANLLDLVKGS